jgi:hypothetical protein
VASRTTKTTIVTFIVALAVGGPACRRSQPPGEAKATPHQQQTTQSSSPPASPTETIRAEEKPASLATASSQPPVTGEPQAIGGPEMDLGRAQQAGGVSCIDYDKYFVVTRELRNEVGSDTLVKFKSAPAERVPCEYSVLSRDLEIKNEFAENFMGLHGDLLFLDSSTGPGTSGMTIYSLLTRKKVFETSYLGPIRFSGDNLTLWQVEKEYVTKADCPDAEKIAQQGMDPTVERKRILNLQTFVFSDTTETRCGTEQ